MWKSHFQVRLGLHSINLMGLPILWVQSKCVSVFLFYFLVCSETLSNVKINSLLFLYHIIQLLVHCLFYEDINYLVWQLIFNLNNILLFSLGLPLFTERKTFNNGWWRNSWKDSIEAYHTLPNLESWYIYSLIVLNQMNGCSFLIHLEWLIVKM